MNFTNVKKLRENLRFLMVFEVLLLSFGSLEVYSFQRDIWYLQTGFNRRQPHSFSEYQCNKDNLNTFEKALQRSAFVHDDGFSFKFQVFYSSDNRQDIGLGMGWAYSFSDRISVNYDVAIRTDHFGKKIQYIGENYFLDNQTVTMKFIPVGELGFVTDSFQFENRDEIIAKQSGGEQTYKKFGNNFHLTKLWFPNQENILIQRLVDGRISKISTQTRYFVLNWSKGQDVKLLSVTDNEGESIQFIYERGVLQKSEGCL